MGCIAIGICACCFAPTQHSDAPCWSGRAAPKPRGPLTGTTWAAGSPPIASGANPPYVTGCGTRAPMTFGGARPRGGGMAPGGMAPGGMAPGGMAPGGMAPGGMAPGGMAATGGACGCTPCTTGGIREPTATVAPHGCALAAPISIPGAIPMGAMVAMPTGPAAPIAGVAAPPQLCDAFGMAAIDCESWPGDCSCG